MTLTVGQLAPDFNLLDQNGKEHRLSDYRGKYVLIYFYPKDDTPGCTTEACSVRDRWGDFKKYNIVVLGISTDGVKSHAKFAAKFELPFPLLSDSEKKVVELYGVWGVKKFMGRTFQGTRRQSFLIDPAGKVVVYYSTVKSSTHAAEALSDIKHLLTSAEAMANPS